MWSYLQQKHDVRRIPCYVVTVLVCIWFAACGSNGDVLQMQSSTKSASPQVVLNNTGKLVDPDRVPGALRHTGLHIIFRYGPIPTGFTGSTYGTASNAHGAKINFGFFTTPVAKAGEYERPELAKLVPGATNEGSTIGESYIAITSAGAGSKRDGQKEREEFGIASELHWAVAGLAPKALREEGP